MDNPQDLPQISIASVCYANSLPFIYALQQENSLFKLILQPPSDCYRLLTSKEVDIALIPSGGYDPKKMIKLTNYCISSYGKVNSVLLCSNNKPETLKQIYLDSHSLTSSTLVKLFAKNYWKISPNFVTVNLHSDSSILVGSEEGVLIIGDKALTLQNKYKYIIDLSYLWWEYTSLPFVFAVWASYSPYTQYEKILNKIFQQTLENDLEKIINHEQTNYPHIDLKTYLTENIRYKINSKEERSLNYFVDLREKCKIC